MDDLALTVNSLVMLDDLNSNSVSNNIASNIHPRLDAYKKCSTFRSSQEERRKSLLIEQKKKRSSLTNSNRNLKDLIESNSTSDKKHKKASVNTTVESKAFKKQNPLYNNQLMFSEWLEEEPYDFKSKWIMVVCPVGQRCLLVASGGTTTAYKKTGKQICRHSSKLPGGNKESKSDYTILDCIFNFELQTYFLLDVLVYKSHPVIDSETDFRFFWLKCKLDEEENLNTACYGNPYKFLDLPRLYDTSHESIQSFLEKPFEFETDGILFYHKETHYTSGHTPLVLWLKHYMLPEILDIPISFWIQSKTPSDYKGYKDAIHKSNIEQKKIEKYLAEAQNRRQQFNEKTIFSMSDISSTDDETCQVNTYNTRHFSDMTESSQSSLKAESGLDCSQDEQN